MSYNDEDLIRDMSDEIKKLINNLRDLDPDDKWTEPSANWVADELVKIVQMACRHEYTAGMMYVDDEDLDTVAREREQKGLSPLECEKCGDQYQIED